MPRPIVHAPRTAPASAPAPRRIGEAPPRTGRRGAARLRLGIPARLVTLHGTLACDLVDLSLTGARVCFGAGRTAPLAEGDGAVLRVGGIDAFGLVVRSGGSTAALAFEDALGEGDVLAVRGHAEGLEREGAHTLRRAAHAFVSGSR